MVDIEKQIAYWKTSAEEDWAAARRLVDGGMARHGLFFAHLSLEKLLKGLVCRRTQELAPRIHNLVRLAELAGVKESAGSEILKTFGKMNEFQMEGRYPEFVRVPSTKEDAVSYMNDAEEAWQWLLKQY